MVAHGTQRVTSWLSRTCTLVSVVPFISRGEGEGKPALCREIDRDEQRQCILQVRQQGSAGVSFRYMIQKLLELPGLGVSQLLYSYQATNLLSIDSNFPQNQRKTRTGMEKLQDIHDNQLTEEQKKHVQSAGQAVCCPSRVT